MSEGQKERRNYLDFDWSEKVWEYPSLGLNILVSTKESHDLPEIKLSIMQMFI